MIKTLIMIVLLVFSVSSSFAEDNYFWAPCPEAAEDSEALSVDDLLVAGQSVDNTLVTGEITGSTVVSIDQTQYHIDELKREWKDEVYYNNTTLSFKDWVAEQAEKH